MSLFMSTPPNNEEKRLTLRMALRLPIVVSGRSEDGAAWSEPTETDDISTMGALFHLNQKVQPGERLYLRAHRPDGTEEFGGTLVPLRDLRRSPHAGGVDEAVGASVDLDDGVDGVARGARFVVDDAPLLSDDAVEECRFPDVRTTHDRDRRFRGHAPTGESAVPRGDLRPHAST